MRHSRPADQVCRGVEAVPGRSQADVTGGRPTAHLVTIDPAGAAPQIGWGVGMVLGFWDYARGPITDSDIDDELRRMRR